MGDRRRRSYRDAADRQRGRANKGLCRVNPFSVVSRAREAVVAFTSTRGVFRACAAPPLCRWSRPRGRRAGEWKEMGTSLMVVPA